MAAILLLMILAATSCGSGSMPDELFNAIGSGDLATVRHLAPRAANIDARLKYGLTAYQWARIHGHAEILDFLVSQGADTDAVSPTPPDIVDAVLNDIVRPDGPGAAVLIAQRGEILFKKGYGLADVERGIPIGPQTRFRIGSISKGFTAGAILKLEEAGRLSVRDKLLKFIPDFPRGEEVTLEHLLTHTSGIHSYTENPEFMAAMGRHLGADTLLAAIKQAPFDFAPGERLFYSNSGYFLLAQVIENVSGRTYAEYLRENLFVPLGLSATGVHQATELVAGEARGYRWSGSAADDAPAWDMSRLLGNGSLYSTIEDLKLWMDALFGGKVVGEPGLRAMFSPARTAQDDSNATKTEGYGYGWAISRLRGLPQIWHSGGFDGFASCVMRFPTDDFSVILLTNARPPVPGMNVDELCPLIAQVFLTGRMELRRAPKIDWTISPSVYDAYIGRYDYGKGVGILTVTREGDRLFAHLTGRGKLELFPESETEFVFDWKVIDARVRFVADEKGQVVKAIHRQAGEIIQAPKLP